MSERTFQILAGCQNADCAAEVSYHLDMLCWWKDKPICEECFKDLPYTERSEPGVAIDDDDGLIDWSDLDPLQLSEARE